MTDSRTAILANIRANLKRAARLPMAAEVELSPPTPAEQFDRSALMNQFGQELTQLGGQFLVTRRERCLPGLMKIVAERKAKSVLMWGREALPITGLRAALQREKVALVGPIVPAEGAGREARVREAAGAQVGITGAQAALADTGTLLLRSGSGQGRLASLIVETHVAIVTPEQFYPSLRDWLEAKSRGGDLADFVAEASNLVLITGPSRTADIEMTLTIGVHGPKELIVICLAD